jgi:hypothetical protein
MRLLLFVLFISFTNVNGQSFPNPATLSTGQGVPGNTDPIWLVSQLFTSNPPNPIGLVYSPALINNNCAPGAWVSPSALPAPINNGNWITQNGIPCGNGTNGFIYFRLQLNLPSTCNGSNIATNGNYTLYLSGYVDDIISDVFVNGISQGVSGGSFGPAGQINMTLNNSWTSGLNYVDVLVRNTGSGPYGLLLVANYSASLNSDLDGDGIPDLFDACPCEPGGLPDGCCLVPNIIPAFTQVAPICSGATLSALPTTSNNGISGNWSPALNNTTTTTYTFTPDVGQCASTTTMTIVVNPNNVNPLFNQVQPICSGGSINPLPTISNNGIAGTWSPTLNNQATTTYTFTPTVGQCATITTMTITVNPNITPTFTQVPAICSQATLSALPTTSTNGYTGTWSPALNNTATTTYTFTPNTGQCATTATMTITVNPNITPTFTQVSAICQGTSLNALPTTSNNGISGNWSPALNNTATTTYTFIPTSGQCATITTMTLVVNSLPESPSGDPIQTFCSIENPTISDLVLNSNSILWFNTANGGQQLSPNTSLTDGMILYAQSIDTSSGCLSLNRFAVEIELVNPSLPNIERELKICIEDQTTVAMISTNGVPMNWYNSPFGGNVVPSNYILQNGDILYGSSIDVNSGCESTNRITVEIQTVDSNLTFYNLITVDNNNLNEKLIINGLDRFESNSIEIYNRYGTLVWKTVNYNNDNNFFNGMSNVNGVVSRGSYLPSGTYFFILSYPNNCSKSELKGFMQIDNKL